MKNINEAAIRDLAEMLPDGAYNEDLNKIPNFPSFEMRYIIYKGRFFEAKVGHGHDGGMNIKDVTNAGKRGKNCTSVSIYGDVRDTVKLINALHNEYKGDVGKFIADYDQLVQGLKGYERIVIGIDGKEFTGNANVLKGASTFSVLGDYPPLKGRPKKFTYQLAVRGLMNNQLQQTDFYKFTDYYGGEEHRSSKTSTKHNMSIAKDVHEYGKGDVHWQGDPETSNTISVWIHSNENYNLEIIDPKLRR